MDIKKYLKIGSQYKMRRLLLLMLLLTFAQAQIVTGQPLQDKTEKKYVLYFRLNSSAIERNFMGNGATINQMKREINRILLQEGNKMENIHLIATSSPEGTERINTKLALNRALSSRALIQQIFPELPIENIILAHNINNWDRLIFALQNDPSIKHRNELLAILLDPKIKNKDAAIRRNKPAFEEIRHTLLAQERAVVISIALLTPQQKEQLISQINSTPQLDTKAVQQTEKAPAVPKIKTDWPAPIQNPFYLGIKTNGLYDLAGVPNIGVELYLKNNWSVVANYAHAWYRNSGKEWWYRIYGGDLALRKWFGRESILKPLTGHHAGIYFQAYTFDFKLKSSTYGHLAKDGFFGGGVEYGYALPIARRLNLDFTIGLGYLGGEIKEYIPIDGHRVWQKTKSTQWIGPTKAEISLVWLLGRGNENKNKGGKR